MWVYVVLSAPNPSLHGPLTSQYALVDTTGRRNLVEVRSFQGWYLRYALQAVPGVAEVAPLGGFVRQYQVNVDPNKLLAYKIPINEMTEAV